MIFTANEFEYSGVRETTYYRMILLRLVFLSGDCLAGNIIKQLNRRFVKIPNCTNALLIQDVKKNQFQYLYGGYISY